ncbi:MAG: valine--tRNA ligase [Dehalococcoidales bacterium]|nr:valine--tRNA ligase [Dehalococcoidales bacterium]
MFESEQNEMPKAYEAAKVETKWYKYWMKKDYFKPKIDHDKEPFVIMMPPPNVTGGLHVGHALTATLEDIMIRWHRMLGEPTLWLPGFDHAGIAAQVVVERQLAQEGTNKYEMGREKFEKRVWKWAGQCHDTIMHQHQRLGISCDWSRERFTLDEGLSKAVREVFVRLYNKGLIYRGERIINRCPRCATALSDLEVDHKDVTGNLYYIRYKLVDDSDNYLTVATTRPETLLGDTAVAVNPADERFGGLIGKKAIVPVINREIPIVGDDVVDLQFGTGAVKVTPAHDPVDFEIGQRHNLPLVNILNPDATMNENAGPYVGLDRFVCRKTIIADLDRDGLLVKIEAYNHSVGHCFRCHTIVEPIASKQWFVKTEPLAKPAIEAVTDGRITILPDRFTKVYLNWMENIRDWCISRQLWWGHRIPVWYCKKCDALTVDTKDPQRCSACGSAVIEQDPDVLDTWFSSGLWPHSTLGWPDDTEDLRYFYPTSVMETAYDILFFWVARMIMLGIEDTGDIPFRTVYLHGLVRDEKGEKMSKTKGNVVDPLELMDQYGTDALRFALSTGISPGNDTKITPIKMEAGRNFANKMWNATRFVLKSMESYNGDMKIEKESLPLEDRWILSRLNATIADVDRLMKEFQFGEVQRQIHDFLWGEFCDWYIEITKVRLNAGDGVISPIAVLIEVLEKSLRLLHPFMPFITEELWQNIVDKLPEDKSRPESIMIAPYPQADGSFKDTVAEEVMASVVEIIRSIRNARTEYKVEQSKQIEVIIYAGHMEKEIGAYASAIRMLAKAAPSILRNREVAPPENSLVIVLKGVEVIIPMQSMVDIEAEKKRIQKEIEQFQSEVKRLEGRLKDEAFLSKAPPQVVEKERANLAAKQEKLEKLKEHLAHLEA